MIHLRTTAVALVVTGALAIVASSITVLPQGRSASAPGQTARPATPPAGAPARAGTPPQASRGSVKATVPIVVKPALATKLQPLLPPNTTVAIASQGFENLGAFVSAVHVSHNLDIPFATLKGKVVDDGVSLGAAIRALKPAANATAEAQRAEKQAKDEIAVSGSN